MEYRNQLLRRRVKPIMMNFIREQGASAKHQIGMLVDNELAYINLNDEAKAFSTTDAKKNLGNEAIRKGIGLLEL